MSNVVRLSVIIPYYNADEWIGKMLDSLLDQDLSRDDYEIIVIDDGSTQSTTTLMRFVNSNPIIKYHLKENGGVSSARNLGIDLANGKWIYFCDSDDFVRPNTLGFLLDAVEQLDLEMLVCDFRIVQTNDTIRFSEGPFHLSEVYTGLEYLESFASNPCSIGFPVWRYLVMKQTLIDNNIRFEDLVYIEDSIFQLDLLLVVKRLAHSDVPLYYYVQHETSFTHLQKKEKYELYASWLWDYIIRLSDMIQDNSLELSANAIAVLDEWRDWGVYKLLTNCLRYCPVSVTKTYFNMIPGVHGVYPLKIKGNKKHRLARRIMGHKGLWIALCRVFHFLPKRIRQKISIK